jgi:small-conductance mechanosensitive channel
LLTGLISEKISVYVLSKTTRKAHILPDNGLVEGIQGPMRLLVAFALALGWCSWLRLPAGSALLVERILYVGIIYAVMKGSVRLVAYLATIVQDQTIKDVEEQTKARAIATRVTTIRRIANVLVVVIGISLALMQFPAARAAGLSLLGSAGLAGAILGFAAQKTFSNLFAGVLISLTQPIRIGDSVNVEGEFGTIEEIGATHVVIRIWDLRRLVVPVTYFLDKHFENWTRTGTELLGTVFVHADYRTKLDDIREVLEQVLQHNESWNRKTKSVIVHELNDHVAVFRILLSADDADKLFTLRCDVREKMLEFLQSSAERLPVRRVENRGGGET